MKLRPGEHVPLEIRSFNPGPASTYARRHLPSWNMRARAQDPMAVERAARLPILPTHDRMIR